MTDDDRSTVGTPMVGDPRITAGSMHSHRACQYAAAMLSKAGTLAGDLSRFDAHHDGEATITFVAADSTQREAARFTIPARVLAFDPYRPPKRLPDLRDEAAEENKIGRTA